MTAYLFISAATDAKAPRRVDLENYARLFSDIDEPEVVATRGPFIAWLSAILLLVLTVGVVILIERFDRITRVSNGAASASLSAPKKL